MALYVNPTDDYLDDEYDDSVLCNQCGWVGVVRVGSEDCPHCKTSGCLSDNDVA